MFVVITKLDFRGAKMRYTPQTMREAKPDLILSIHTATADRTYDRTASSSVRNEQMNLSVCPD